MTDGEKWRSLMGASLCVHHVAVPDIGPYRGYAHTVVSFTAQSGVTPHPGRTAAHEAAEQALMTVVNEIARERALSDQPPSGG